MAQTLTNVKSEHRLSATMASNATKTSGTLIIGDASIVTNTFTDADIAYAFRINATGATDVATLTITSGAIAQTTATPDIVRWTGNIADTAGEDLHGQALVTLVTWYAFVLTTPNDNTGSVVVACSAAEGIDQTVPKNSHIGPISFLNGVTSPGTMAFTFSNAGDEITGHIIGKSS